MSDKFYLVVATDYKGEKRIVKGTHYDSFMGPSEWEVHGSKGAEITKAKRIKEQENQINKDISLEIKEYEL